MSGTTKEIRNTVIPLNINDLWQSLQEKCNYYLVIVGPTTVRIKSVDDPNIVVTMDKERLLEWFSRTGEVYSDSEEAIVEVS